MKVTARIELPKKLTAKFKELKMPLSGGYDEGYKDGYDKGYDKGYDDARIVIPTFEGNLSYAFAYGAWDWFLKEFKDEIVTKDITDGAYMFQNSKVEQLPKIKINIVETGASCRSMYRGLTNIATVDFNSLEGCRVTSLTELFYGCRRLRNINSDFLLELQSVRNKRASFVYELKREEGNVLF